MTCKERSVNMVLYPKGPVKRDLWTWHSPPQMIFSSSIGLWSWSTIHPQSVYSLGADIYVNQQQSTLSHLRLQHMQQCQVIKFVSMIWSKWVVHEKWSPQRGFEPRTSRSWVFCLTTRPWLLASGLTTLKKVSFSIYRWPSAVLKPAQEGLV